MYFDGLLNIDGARAGVYFVLPSRDKLRYVLRIHFKASNNTAEYEAALHVYTSPSSSAFNASWSMVILPLSSTR
jgi:hypothetical protein